MNIPKVLGTAFIEQLQWLDLHQVLVLEKNFLKKKVSGEIAFGLKLACLMYKYKSL